MTTRFSDVLLDRTGGDDAVDRRAWQACWSNESLPSVKRTDSALEQKITPVSD